MKNLPLFTFFLLVLFTVPIKSIAQETPSGDSTIEHHAEEKSFGLVSTNYYSNIVFLGRKSPSRDPYLSAFAGYYHKSGLFINGGASYLAASGENRIDLLTATTGYDLYLGSFSGGISGTKYFFDTKSNTVKSELSGYVNVYADYDFDIVDVYIEGNAYFGNTSDFISGLGISHKFYAANDNLTITPAVYLNAGTQNYYSNYNNNLRFGLHMTEDDGSSMRIAMGGRRSFKALDYELSVPVGYTLNKFRFSFTPVYAMPVNAATITNGQNTYKEDLSNSFFWSLGVSYKFL
jgi:hypothetical protein